MKGVEFPIIGTKKAGVSKKFDLSSPAGRKLYYQAKAGDEIAKLRKYLAKQTFMAIMLGKKNAGKGTYTKLFAEIFGEGKVAHVAVGDLVRDIHANWADFSKSAEPERFKRHYRGLVSFDEAVAALLSRSTDKLLPTEFVLALLKYNIAKLSGKTLFVDGIPRDLDQISYSLYFRDLINFRGDTDLFVLIDIPEVVIDERIKFRRICPVCKSPRNLKLLVTSKVDYDPKKKEFFLRCDNPGCGAPIMIPKEGDDLGIAPIRERLTRDEEIMKTVMKLYGVPKVFLRNSIPVDEAKKQFDEYEMTPAYSFSFDQKKKKVKVHEAPWIFLDDNEVRSYSLLPAPVVVAMIKQLVEVLGV